MTADSGRVIEIFTEANQLPVEERDAFLDRACAEDDELRRKIEALLGSNDRAEGFLEQPPGTFDEARDKATAWEKPGDTMDRYKLLEQIGEGGCGVVFVAEQQGPVPRRVALKVVKPGMDSKSVIARFEAERQALALMDHPGIAHVFDAGATERGRPYFVMELVEGLRITDYCDRHSLSVSARLELFIQVCDAIQHAHQKGIIHRDIKPSNIIVTTGPDGKAVPKVIDFGIAKATAGQRLTDKTIFTECEMLIGTPAYMSPEQAAFASADSDTRTDVYSLGVLLYELLTGTTPFDTRELLKAGLDEVRRVILEEEPVRPSVRLSTMMAGDLKTAGQHRKAEPPKLVREVQGDPDWIVMKALEKDRRRRYQTASSMAEDIHRYLNHETVTARPPSVAYKFQKLIVRHKVVFGALGIVVMALAAGLTVALWSLREEKRAHSEAETARQEADKQRKKAEQNEQSALTALARVRQTQLFMNDMLLGVNPAVANGRDTTLLRDIFDKAVARLEREMTSHPEFQADLRFTIGRAFGTLGYPDKQEPLLLAALAYYRKTPGLEKKLADSLSDLAHLHISLMPPKLEEAEEEAREALAVYIKLLGEANMEVVTMRSQLGRVILTRGRTQEAEAMLREAFDTGRRLAPSDPDELVETQKSLGWALVMMDRAAEGEPLLREVRAILEKKYGATHLITANSVFLLAMSCDGQGKLDEAETLHRECLAMRRKLVAKDHPLIEGSLSAVGGILMREKKWREAAEDYDELLGLLMRRYGEKDPRVAKARASLAEARRMIEGEPSSAASPANQPR